jgi:hypothetical protein
MIFHRTDLVDRSPVGRRPVILHFHTFKNAGSTVDAVLQACFPGAWANYDGPVPEFFIHHSEIAIIARNRAQLKAISSHQIRLPNPEFPGIEFLPIVFIRRPELRIASIWRFQRQRNDDHPATILAKKLSFKDWVAHCLDGPRGLSIRNQQSHLFSFRMDKRTTMSDPRAFEYAKENITTLPFMGVVEHFDASMRIYERLYSPKIREFRYEQIVAMNVTGNHNLSTEEQLVKLERELGGDLFERVQIENSHDIALYELAHSRLMTLMEQETSDGLRAINPAIK